MSSSVRDEKSLQQLQEEVALNGLPPTVRATRHTRPAEVFVRFFLLFLKSVQIAPLPAHPRTPTRPAAANRMSNNNRHQEIKINLCIFYKKNKKSKRHIVFQLFLESLWNIQNAQLKIRICYITYTKIMLCLFLLF